MWQIFESASWWYSREISNGCGYSTLDSTIILAAFIDNRFDFDGHNRYYISWHNNIIYFVYEFTIEDDGIIWWI